jgi:hypothetical protein
LSNPTPIYSPHSNVDEDGNPIRKSKIKANFKQKRKRRPITPNVNGVDRIEITSKDERGVEIKCRFLYKDKKPQKITVRIPLPKKSSIATRIKRKYPNATPEQIVTLAKIWLKNFIKQKLKNHWKSFKSSQEDIEFNELIEV